VSPEDAEWKRRSQVIEIAFLLLECGGLPPLCISEFRLQAA
jgi:hypothetical protein